MKRVLGFILVSMMLMTMTFTVSVTAEGAAVLDDVTRNAITVIPSDDATFKGDKLHLNFAGVTFTSSDETVINPTTGVVTRPEQTKSVILTAEAGGETKDFAFRIPGKFEEINTESILYYNDFSSTAGGKPQFVGGTGGQIVGDPVYITEDQTAVDGKFKVEFLLTRTSYYQTNRIYFYDNAGNSPIHMTWLGADANDNTNIEISSAASQGGTKVDYMHYTTKGQKGNALGELKVVAEFDCGTGEIQLWLNDVKVPISTSGGYMAGTAVSLSHISIAGYSEQCNLWLDYMGCSNIKAFGENDPDAVPYLVKHFDDFEGGTLSASVDQVNGSPIIAASADDASNKSLQFTSATAQASAGSYYLNETRTSATGQFKIEFNLLRDYAYGANGMYFYDDADNLAFYLVWAAWNGVDATVNLNVSGGRQEYPQVDFRSLKIVADVDCDADTVTFTVNGTPVNTIPFSKAANGLTKFMIVNYVASQPLELDNIKVTDYTGANANVTTNYYETFQTQTLSDRVQSINNMQQSNGKLMPTDATGVSSAKIYLQTNNADVTGKFTIGVNATRANTQNTTDIVLRDAENHNYGTIRWWAASTGSTYVFHGNNYSFQNWASIPDGDTRLSVKATIDTTTNTFSVWVNGVSIAEDVPREEAQATGVAYVVLNNGYGPTDASLLDVVYYREVVTLTKPEVSAYALDYNAYDKKVSVLSPEARTVTVVAAAYAGDALVSVMPVEVTLAEDGSVLADTGDLNVENATGVKLFLWSDMADLIPLHEPTLISDVLSAN